MHNMMRWIVHSARAHIGFLTPQTPCVRDAGAAIRATDGAATRMVARALPSNLLLA
jgi:hypothetical protein